VSAEGPDHEKRFRIEVAVEGVVLGTGEGMSRRVAETAAAAEALDTLALKGGPGEPDATRADQATDTAAGARSEGTSAETTGEASP
jgi:ribonuclease-3